MWQHSVSLPCFLLTKTDFSTPHSSIPINIMTLKQHRKIIKVRTDDSNGKTFGDTYKQGVVQQGGRGLKGHSTHFRN